MKSKRNQQSSSRPNHNIKSSKFGSGICSLCTVFVLSSVSLMACQNPTPVSTNRTVLLVSGGTSAQPNQLDETKKILAHRLQEAGYPTSTVTLQGKELRVELPRIGEKQYQSLKQDVFSHQGILSLTPLVKQAGTFSRVQKHLLKSGALTKTGLSIQKETWKGPNGAEHSTFSLRHQDQKILSKHIQGLAEKRETAPLAGQAWIIKKAKESKEWAAYLVDQTQALRIQQLEAVEAGAVVGKQASYSLRLKAKDGRKLRTLTARNIGNRMFLKLDKKILAAPIVMAAIRGSALRLSVLSGGSNEPLIRMLGLRALPIKLQVKMRY